MMKKTLLAITMATLISAPAISAPVKVDRALANQYTAELIEAQMNEIDARVLAQLNAQPSATTTATVDDVVYEKQSDGTWAAVGTVSATLLAGLLSSSSSTGGQVDDLPDLPIDAPRQLPDVDVSTPDNTKPDFDFISNGTGTIQIVVDGVILGTIEGSANTRHLEVGPNGGVWYNDPQTPVSIPLPFKVETAVTGHLIITDLRTGEIVGVGGQFGGDMAPIKLTVVKSDLGWTIFGTQGRSITIKNVDLERPDPESPIDGINDNPIHNNPEWKLEASNEAGVYTVYRDGVVMGRVVSEASGLTVIRGNSGGVVSIDRLNREVTTDEQAKETIKTLVKQPRFDDVRNKVRAKLAQ
ncbi:hypothetical protein L4C54_15835 [Vibrio lamellibrachiae]|uniref:hypothetical protein n=1 Tax=Vibrio lamellibrachiae TaxID=2910253 RepID=UPI003D0C1D10